MVFTAFTLLAVVAIISFANIVLLIGYISMKMLCEAAEKRRRRKRKSAYTHNRNNRFLPQEAKDYLETLHQHKVQDIVDFNFYEGE